MRDEKTYAYENARPVQRERLAALAEALDAGTIRHLDSIGVGRGWRCLEVGAGGGSIAAWLSERVAGEGAVVATDLDTTVLRGLSRPNLEIRVHDVLEDDLPEGEFDLVHLRLLLAWLSEPQRALRRLATALKPGGRLLAEEMDFTSVAPDPHLDSGAQGAFARVAAAHDAVLSGEHGFDLHYGRRVAGDLADAGLADVACEGRVSMWRGPGRRRPLAPDDHPGARADAGLRPRLGGRHRARARALRRPGLRLGLADRHGRLRPPPRLG